MTNNKKVSVLASEELAHAIDMLTKHALIDLVIDLARKNLGDEDASDWEIASLIQQWHDPVARIRQDPRPRICDRLRRVVADHQAYAKAQQIPYWYPPEPQKDQDN